MGRQLISSAKKYVAVDIVSDLIEHNKKTFKAANLEFHCLDIATDALPPGDCAILRNVLQHLSNADIEQIVPKLSGFDHVIVTEHVPEGDFSPNADIISGQGIRLKKVSGVDLTAPPFNFKVRGKEQWLSLPYEDGKGFVETTLY
ncbi:MAG TPA: hypothetical protein DD671_15000 [Balneolaceae bacterium]|nr:hypothetical protein [Balneolaceae bacterium]